MTRIRIVVSTLLALLIVASPDNASAQETTEQALKNLHTKVVGVPFAVVDGIELKLDLYLPDDAAKPPLVVWVHPGAWRSMSRDSFVPEYLLDFGFAVASLDFRQSTQATFPAQVHDIKAGIRFLRHSAAEYDYDASRVAIMGASSGGHLAALVGVSNGHSDLEGAVGNNLTVSSDVHAIVSLSGASNITTIIGQTTPRGLSVRVPALELLLGGQPDEVPQIARLASPVFHVDANDPPLLLIHGDQDFQMPINQSHELFGAYLESGLQPRFEVVYGAAHGGPMFEDMRRSALVNAFLEEHLH